MKRTSLENPCCLPVAAVPLVPLDELSEKLAGLAPAGLRLLALFAAPRCDAAEQRLIWALIGDDQRGKLEVLRTIAPEVYPAFTQRCPQAHLFEREISEQFGLAPQAHPWLKPVRGEAPWAADHPHETPPAPADNFFQVHGDGVHEVAVGPVHAGVIEPGHFRFQCHGEEVLHLEIALGYQHRGIERALAGGPHRRTLYQIETAAGDTSIGHLLAYCQLIEQLQDCRVPPRGEALRALALELERLANHIGDLGALAGDVAFLSTAAYCGRIRGDFLNMTALACGSRVGRGWLLPGGVRFDLEAERVTGLRQGMRAGLRDLQSAMGLLMESASAVSRFEGTGSVSLEDAQALGLVGPAARACGAARDVRRNYPSGYYRRIDLPLALGKEGSVADRARVRWGEIQHSIAFIELLLDRLPPGEIRSACAETPLPPGCFAASLIEGWRGEICHCAVTDENGTLLRYKIIDPSFHNWMGLAMALRGAQISDFPLCNKSFNLSYAGFDL